MYFTHKTDFTGDIFIANLNEKCDNLDFYGLMSQWEEECLRITLGDCVYEQLVDQLEWDDTTNIYKFKDGTEDKWKWLVDGHSYDAGDITQPTTSYLHCGCGCNNQNCDTYHWDGIRKVIDRRIPPTTIEGVVANGVEVTMSYTAYYIYWLWSLNDDSFTSGTGEQTADVKNANRISNSHKRIKAHNAFVSWVSGCNSHGKVGLYKFVQDFSDLYPEWQGKCLKYEPIW